MNPVNLPRDGFWIYLIVNRINRKIYVGKTSNAYKRCHQYLYDFKTRNIGHLNDHMFNAMTKYGIKYFEMVIWDECQSSDHLTMRELFWIDFFESTNRNKGYNLRRDSRVGMITHPETSAKIRANITRQWAEGVRDGHSEKLKLAWENASLDRRVQQSKRFTASKTKYHYVVSPPSGETIICTYADLTSLGLRSVLSSFNRSGSDVAELKGHRIERVCVCPN